MTEGKIRVYQTHPPSLLNRDISLSVEFLTQSLVFIKLFILYRTNCFTDFYHLIWPKSVDQTPSQFSTDFTKPWQFGGSEVYKRNFQLSTILSSLSFDNPIWSLNLTVYILCEGFLWIHKWQLLYSSIDTSLSEKKRRKSTYRIEWNLPFSVTSFVSQDRYSM